MVRDTLIERLMTDLVIAHANEWTVSIDYTKLDGTRTRRVIVPQEIFYAPTSGKFCMRAYDATRREARTFRLDNIRAYTVHKRKLMAYEPSPP